MRPFRHRQRHPLHRARIAASSLILVLLAAAFFAGGEPSAAAANASQFLPGLLRTLAGGFGLASAGWILIALLTILFGRVYCSSLCPLGTLQDAAGALGRRLRGAGRKYRAAGPLPDPRAGASPRSKSFFRFLVPAGALLLGASGSMVLLILTEPYSIWNRGLRNLVMPVVALAHSILIGPLAEQGIYLAPAAYRPDPAVAIGTAILLITVLGLAALRGRSWCNGICPAGAVLSLLAVRPRFRIAFRGSTCTACGRCERTCPADCIDSAAKQVDSSRCVACFSCLSACPSDALAYAAGKSGDRFRSTAAALEARPGAEPPASGAAGIGRRDFLRRAGGAIAVPAVLASIPFLPIPVRSMAPDGSRRTPATPPGSVSLDRFTGICTACHLCISRCPSGVLQPSLAEYGLSGLFQPVMDYASGYCDYECVICSRVCPSGAILPIPVEEKKRTRVGRSRFEKDDCIIFTQGTACGACAEHCPTHAVIMTDNADGIPEPSLEEKHCIGCGACENVCPAEPRKAIWVVGLETHEHADEPAVPSRPANEARPPEGDKPAGDFPF